ncbi:MAG: 50S ribosome-binding GTPase [Bacteroidetes bacterium]|nr:50S ribosome-binding GTPase [Bacteroidota bacterium]
MDIFKNIKKLLKENDLDSFITEISILIMGLKFHIDDDDFTELENNLIIVCSRYNANQDRFRKGIIKEESYIIEGNRIITEFNFQLKELDYFYKKLNINTKNNNQIGGEIKNDIHLMSNILEIDSMAFNVLILGKSGVGKSSLLNYLFNKEIQKTGIGEPVTEFGLHKVTNLINDVEINIFDSGGIELGNLDKWEENIKSEIQKRNNDTPITNWFHSIVYCFSMGETRIDDFELAFLKEISKKENVIVALTMSDKISEQNLETMCEVITTKGGISKSNVVDICSIDVEHRFGIINKYGREELIELIYDGIQKSIIEKMPKRCILLLDNHIDKWEKVQINTVNLTLSGLDGFFRFYEAEKNLKKEVTEFQNKFETQVNDIIYGEIRLAIDVSSHLLSVLNKKKSFKINKLSVNSISYDDGKYLYRKFLGLTLVSILGGAGIFEVWALFQGEFSLGRVLVREELIDKIKTISKLLKYQVEKIEPSIKNNIISIFH